MTPHDRASHLETIKAFVEGSLPAQDFVRWLYESPDLPECLDTDFVLPDYVVEPTLHAFLIVQDYASAESLFNTQALLSEFLNSQAVAHTKDPRYERLFNLLLQAQPKWLRLTGDYLANVLNGQSDDHPKAELSRLKARIKDDFRYLKRPPNWLQSPDWPIEEGKPLIFVGQIDTTGLHHDSSHAYVFFNPDTQGFVTLGQRC
ncbi:hypothetical protein [Xanthomonas maliensis]|uniref:hypothetical protein n=1 Tax=Xanthomonas maliensis TaxID=1321368 RepID=UPI0012650886|nr:hypothetical protein [Xanthomonas maliensis]KAB7769765.1 hypothetical protein CKY51_06440 [Xanthomonas maliensis]